MRADWTLHQTNSLCLVLLLNIGIPMMDISCCFRSQPITHAQTTNAGLASMSQFNQTEYSILIIQRDAHVIDFCEFIGSRLVS